MTNYTWTQFTLLVFYGSIGYELKKQAIKRVLAAPIHKGVKKMLRIAICDDEDIHIRQINQLVSDTLTKVPVLFSTDSFSSGEALFYNLQNGTTYDIALLDIHMDGISGIDIAGKIRNHLKDDKIILIYISAYDKRAKELFQFNTHRFLSKPIETHLFEEALLSAVELWKDQQFQNFIFKDRKLGCVEIPINDILYIENSHSHCVDVVTTDATYTIYNGRLSDIHEKLSSSDFILIHQSTLINFHHVRSVTYEEVTMSNKKALSISGPKRKEVRKLFYEIRKRQEKNLWL